MPEVIDDIGHTIDIPDKEFLEMQRRCGICHVPKQYKKAFNMDISYMNCPYNCTNDIYHYRRKYPERVSYK